MAKIGARRFRSFGLQARDLVPHLYGSGSHFAVMVGWNILALDVKEIGNGVMNRDEPLERENRELRQANEILRKASAYFAMAELDRPFKR